MKLDEAMSQDMTGRYADELIDSAAEPWHETAEVRMPNAELYNPLARLWQLEELDEQYRADNELHHELHEPRSGLHTDALLLGPGQESTLLHRLHAGH